MESSKIDGTLGGPYCTPAEVAIPTFTKWMLVFEEPDDAVVWLASATPREWLEQGKKIAVTSGADPIRKSFVRAALGRAAE